MFFIGIFMIVVGICGFLPEYLHRKNVELVDAYVTNVKYVNNYNHSTENMEKYYKVTYTFSYNGKQRTYIKTYSSAPEIGDYAQFVANDKFVGDADGYNTGFHRSIIFAILGVLVVIKCGISGEFF